MIEPDTAPVGGALADVDAHTNARTAPIQRIPGIAHEDVYHSGRCSGFITDGEPPRWHVLSYSVRRRAKTSRRSGRCWCSNRSITASRCSTTLPAIFAWTWTSAWEAPSMSFRSWWGRHGLVGASDQALLDYIRSAFVDRPKPDLIMAIAGPASAFARKNRQQLFPDTPLLFASVDQRYLEAPLGDNETAVAVDNHFADAIEALLRLLPETRQIVMVLGSGQIGQFWHRELEGQFSRFRDRLTFIWLDDLSLPEVLRRCASLPDHSAIFYLTFGTDAGGAAYADARVVADIHAAANAPLFGSHSVFMGGESSAGR